MDSTIYNTRVRVPEIVSNTGYLYDDSTPVLTYKCDDVLLKPKGGTTSDDITGRGKSRRKVALFRCKKNIKVGTMNVRTIRKESRLMELACKFEQYEIDILALQEHRIFHKDEEIVYKKCGKSSTLITASCERNDMNAAVRGVGFLLSDRAMKAVKSVEKVSNRIIVLNLTGNPKATIICAYSPCNTSEDEEIEEFYDDLSETINNLPAHNFLMLVGDLNAHLGKDVGRFTFHETTNRNGELLNDLAAEMKLCNTSTVFKKKLGKLWTHISPKGDKAQLDYILCRNKWRNSITNTEAYNTFGSVGSDHRIVVSRVRLSLRSNTKKPEKKVILDWNLLRQDPSLADNYSVEISNRFDPLMVSYENNTDQADTAFEELYDQFAKINHQVAEELIPKLPKAIRKKEQSSHPTIVEASKNTSEAFNEYTLDPSPVNKIRVEETKIALDTAYDLVKEEEINSAVNDINNDQGFGRLRKMWNLVHSISGKRSVNSSKIKGDTPEERVDKWKQHFKKLLGQPPDATTNFNLDDNILNGVDISDSNFTEEEYNTAVKNMSDGKNGGADGIRPEILKRCKMQKFVLKFCNIALNSGCTPKIWSEINIIPIPKKGNLSDCGNYRGISMCSVVTKLMNKMILNRIRTELDPLLRKSQNGFRPGRSTTAHILSLRRIIEGVKAKNLPAVIIFIDFKKAFDSITRSSMYKILLAYGVPKKIVDLIKAVYINTKARVETPDGNTDLFDILAGIMQGDTLAPYLFIIAVDYILRKVFDENEELGFTLQKRRSKRYPTIKVTDCAFADDLATTSDNIEEAQRTLYLIEEAAALVGLKINPSKTEYMKFNQEEGHIRASDGNLLNEVDDYKYLGAWISSSKKDISTRIAIAWSTAHKLDPIWKSKLPNNTKVRLLTSTVESVLLYGCESWTLNTALTKRLDGVYTRLLRFALNISWKDKVRNTTLYGKLPKLTDKIRARRLRLAGHCVRHDEEIASSLILWDPPHGRRSRGRPPTTFIDTLKRDTGLNNVGDLGRVMKDRVGWQSIVKARGPQSSPG